MKINFFTKIATYSFYIPSMRFGSGGWAINPPKGYRIRRDHENPPNSQKHYHIYKNGQIGVINHDGTGSHKTALEDIPNPIRQYFQEGGIIIPNILANLKNILLSDISIEESLDYVQIIK